MNRENFAADSLELHLFFARIMKEHSLFLKAGFTPVNAGFAQRSERFAKEFEKLLCTAAALADGNIGEKVLDSGEIVTEFTLAAERQTERLTGLPIDSSITERELRLSRCRKEPVSDDLICRVRRLNGQALELVNGLISLKEEIIGSVADCRIFTANYPLLIEHILREAKLYIKYIRMLEKNGSLSACDVKETECFWNRIMMEHAQFIRGLLDPTETELIRSADMFAGDYAALLQACGNAQNRSLAADSMAETRKFKDFKAAGAKGIIDCNIRSVILPLLADHVLREANHFIRILEE